jgi:hypothetical protein
MDIFNHESARGIAESSRPGNGNATGTSRHLFLVVLVLVMLSVPVLGLASNAAAAGTTPDLVHIGVYVQDLNGFSPEDGTVEATFYLTLNSQINASINDMELMNGHITMTDVVIDNAGSKEYKITAILTFDPDLRRFPFDRHLMPIDLEPKVKNENEMKLVIDQSNSGINPEADLPGWQFTGTGSEISNRSYILGEVPYSRATFTYGIERDATSTLLKFFLPIMLIIMVALSSLMIKISSRLSLNASMLLAAVLIHWRISDSIPLVAYATFLDTFMVITYATLVMVLISGLLILKYTEAKDQEKIGLVNKWSIRGIPTVSICLYLLLFLSLLL